MTTLVIQNPKEFWKLVHNIENYKNIETEIHIKDPIYSDISRTFTAYHKFKKDHTGGNVARIGGITAAIFATALSGGFLAPVAIASIAGGGIAAWGGSEAMKNAYREFNSNPYARGVSTLAENKFSVATNQPSNLVLRWNR